MGQWLERLRAVKREGVVASKHSHETDPALREALDIVDRAAGVDHLTICFPAEGVANFYPETFDPERLYRRLVWLIEVVKRRPDLLRCAASACGGEHEHGHGFH